MKPLLSFNVALLFLLLLSVLSCKQAVTDEETDVELTKKEELGKLLFFEKSLSTPEGQDCSDCHQPERAFADPESGLPVSKGIVEGRYGKRNDMPVAYASFIPALHEDTVEDIWVGGLFWYGRANSLEAQAGGSTT